MILLTYNLARTNSTKMSILSLSIEMNGCLDIDVVFFSEKQNMYVCVLSVLCFDHSFVVI